MVCRAKLCGLIVVRLANVMVANDDGFGTLASGMCGDADADCSGHDQRASALLQIRSSPIKASLNGRRQQGEALFDFLRKSSKKKSGGATVASKQQKNETQPALVINQPTETESVKAATAKMIRPDTWVCDLILNGDSRKHTCGGPPVDPQHIACVKEPNGCSKEHANAVRTWYQIGSLPCCATPPFCAAPTCASDQPANTTLPTCTKRAAQDNVAYMKQQDVWPAYHGIGGAFELDILKHLDLLGCRDVAGCPQQPFDLMIDLGANSGYFTEQLTVRNFAKNYIMVEADPLTTNTLRSRWGNVTFKNSWLTQQIVPKPVVPDFEIINFALSNQTGGQIDLCKTQAMSNGDCMVTLSTLDSIIHGNLTPEFQKKYAEAQSAFIKVDTEGMDELVLRGMKGLLEEQRGKYEDGSPRHLVNFLQFELSPLLQKNAKDREGFAEFNMKTTVEFLESIGFETFMIGPRFLPLSHGSWSDEFRSTIEDHRNNAGAKLNYPDFDSTLFMHCNVVDCSKADGFPSFTTDVFAMRSSHPRATELKVELGACMESKDFVLQ